RHLGEHVPAVAVFLQHLRDAPQLSDHALEAVLQLAQLLLAAGGVLVAAAAALSRTSLFHGLTSLPYPVGVFGVLEPLYTPQGYFARLFFKKTPAGGPAGEGESVLRNLTGC